MTEEQYSRYKSESELKRASSIHNSERAQDLHDLTMLLNESNQNIDALHKENDALRKNISQMEVQKKSADQILAQHEGLVNEVRDLQNELITKEEEAYTTINTLQEKNKFLTQKLNKSSSERENVNTDLEKEISKLTVQNEYFKEQVKQYQEKLDQVNKTARKRKSSSFLFL